MCPRQPEQKTFLQADESGWLTYEDAARGLSLSLPSDWRYFDPAQPTAADLALLSAANKVSEEQFDVLRLGEIVSAMSLRRDDAVIGLGLQTGQEESEASNFLLVFSFAASDQTLARIRTGSLRADLQY